MFAILTRLAIPHHFSDYADPLDTGLGKRAYFTAPTSRYVERIFV
jgi:hypothetical protein